MYGAIFWTLPGRQRERQVLESAKAVETKTQLWRLVCSPTWFSGHSQVPMIRIIKSSLVTLRRSDMEDLSPKLFDLLNQCLSLMCRIVQAIHDWYTQDLWFRTNRSWIGHLVGTFMDTPNSRGIEPQSRSHRLPTPWCWSSRCWRCFVWYRASM